MISYSHPAHQDIPAIVAVWNASMPAAFPLTERLLHQTLHEDPYREPGGEWIARDSQRPEGQNIIGWVLSKSMKTAGPEVGRFQNRGGIGALCVHPDYQRQGIGSALADRAEEWLQQNGAPRSLLYFPHHLLPGVPAECTAALEFWQQRGYGQNGWVEHYDLWRELNDYQLPSKVLEALKNNPTVEIRPARKEDTLLMLSFLEQEFPGAWTYTTRAHFKHGGNPADFIIAIETQGTASHSCREVIGFCHTADFRSQRLIPGTFWFPLLGEKFGGLGPIGMGQTQRKRGLGLALCALAIEDLQKRGVQQMAIDWTTLLDFYGRLGFSVWKRYLQPQP
ncbi:MAG: hypothetical protein JWN98_2542 [Abditibacteriota bacterium]|nr:hypothetical protein [Abditibacteriota bacterium]